MKLIYGAGILNKIIQQAGVIPFVFDKELKVMIITSRAFPYRWVLPKGHIEEGQSPQNTAIREAFEEAGICGVVSHIPAGAYDYHKFNRNYHVLVYMLKITEILDKWPEQAFRKRRLLPLEYALKALSDANVREIVKAAAALNDKFVFQ
jgi:8-oxo-dGTP pyrophosphatase MutT (NUDIX family)